MILTNNYGEAGALELLGNGLPPVYSGHNGFWYWGPPPADRTVVVHVGDWTTADWSPYFVGCRTVAHIDNGLGIENQEQGQAISVCTRPARAMDGDLAKAPAPLLASRSVGWTVTTASATDSLAKGRTRS